MVRTELENLDSNGVSPFRCVLGLDRGSELAPGQRKGCVALRCPSSERALRQVGYPHRSRELEIAVGVHIGFSPTSVTQIAIVISWPVASSRASGTVQALCHEVDNQTCAGRGYCRPPGLKHFGNAAMRAVP
jgi:hypothetical protein